MPGLMICHVKDAGFGFNYRVQPISMLFWGIAISETILNIAIWHCHKIQGYI